MSKYLVCPNCRGKKWNIGLGMMGKQECEICEGFGKIPNKKQEESESAKLADRTEKEKPIDEKKIVKRRGRPPKVKKDEELSPITINKEEDEKYELVSKIGRQLLEEQKKINDKINIEKCIANSPLGTLMKIK